MDASDWITVGFSVAALIVSGLSVRYTRGQHTEARRANDLLVEDRGRRFAAEEAEREAKRFVWVGERSGRTALVRNAGTETAHNVYISSRGIYPNGVVTRSNPHDDSGIEALYAPTLLPGESVRFGVVTAARVGAGHSMTVWWDEGQEPVVVPIPLGS